MEWHCCLATYIITFCTRRDLNYAQENYELNHNQIVSVTMINQCLRCLLGLQHIPFFVLSSCSIILLKKTVYRVILSFSEIKPT